MSDVHIILAAPKDSKIKPLIQPKGFIIGVDRGALIAVEEKIELDLALGDFDSVTESEYLAIKNHSNEIYSLPEEQEDTDAELALLYILENIVTDKVYLYNWNGGRIDHLYSLLMLVLQERFQPLIAKLRFVSRTNIISYYLPGEYKIREYKHMDYLSLILLTAVENLSFRDVKYPLEEANYELPKALISNEFLNKKEAFLSFEKGIIAVIQSQDRK